MGFSEVLFDLKLSVCVCHGSLVPLATPRVVAFDWQMFISRLRSLLNTFLEFDFHSNLYIIASVYAGTQCWHYVPWCLSLVASFQWNNGEKSHEKRYYSLMLKLPNYKLRTCFLRLMKTEMSVFTVYFVVYFFHFGNSLSSGEQCHNTYCLCFSLWRKCWWYWPRMCAIESNKFAV